MLFIIILFPHQFAHIEMAFAQAWVFLRANMDNSSRTGLKLPHFNVEYYIPKDVANISRGHMYVFIFLVLIPLECD